MSAAAAWRWCLAAGLATIACSIGFGHIPGLQPCGDARGLGPIIGFELARDMADVARLFGDEPCLSTLVAAQRTGLWLDALGFIPSYTAFLSLAAWATGARWRRWIIAAVLLAGLGDEIEGVLLAAILRDLPGTPGLLDALWWEVHVKFVLLGLATAGALGARQASALRALLSIVIAASGAGAIINLFHKPPLMIFQLTVAWALILLAALLGAVWPRLLAPRPPAPAPPSA